MKATGSGDNQPRDSAGLCSTATQEPRRRPTGPVEGDARDPPEGRALGSRAPARIKRSKVLHTVWKVGVFFVGLAVVGAGIVLLPLPGPGLAGDLRRRGCMGNGIRLGPTPVAVGQTEDHQRRPESPGPCGAAQEPAHHGTRGGRSRRGDIPVGVEVRVLRHAVEVRTSGSDSREPGATTRNSGFRGLRRPCSTLVPSRRLSSFGPGRQADGG